MTRGNLVRATHPIRCFDDFGDEYYLYPGESALIIDVNPYDTTILCTGKILYTMSDLFDVTKDMKVGKC